jgi:protein gp37
MADNGSIEWTDATWNLVTGCVKWSPRLYPTKAVQAASALLTLAKSTTQKPRRQSQPKVERAWD